MSLRHTLLGILDWMPTHGYVLRELAKGYSWIYPMTNANIYPALRTLEEEGFVQHEQEIHDGRLRKVYRATEAGRMELRRWLRDSTKQKGVYRDPTMLKICLLREGAFEEACGWLEDQLGESAKVVEDADRFLKEMGEQLPTFTRLVAEYGRDLARMRVKWLDRILEEARQEAGTAAS